MEYELSELLETISRLKEENAELTHRLQKGGSLTVRELWDRDKADGFYLSADTIKEITNEDIYEDAEIEFIKYLKDMILKIDSDSNKEDFLLSRISTLESKVKDYNNKYRDGNVTMNNHELVEGIGKVTINIKEIDEVTQMLETVIIKLKNDE